jgi:hypothetical protein
MSSFPSISRSPAERLRGNAATVEQTIEGADPSEYWTRPHGRPPRRSRSTQSESAADQQHYPRPVCGMILREVGMAMKRVLALLAVLLLTLGLAACGGGDDEGGESEGTATPPGGSLSATTPSGATQSSSGGPT